MSQWAVVFSRNISSQKTCATKVLEVLCSTQPDATVLRGIPASTLAPNPHTTSGPGDATTLGAPHD